jgi:predicted SAM-dependent methyltransferase
MKEIKLDLGCGINKREGFTGVDSLKLKGVDIVADLTKKWPWKDSSVDEIHMSHTLEHFTQEERIHVMNEMYRVLKPVEYDAAGQAVKGKATIITPYLFSDRAYGDPTQKWPAIGDWFYLYLNQEWRNGNAPHVDFKHNKKGEPNGPNAQDRLVGLQCVVQISPDS